MKPETRFFKAKQNGRTDPWFDADAARRDDHARMEAIWQDLGEMPELAHLPAPRPSRRAFLWGGAGLAVAAGVAGVAILPRADLATATGELRNAALPDGTTVLLDAESSVDLDFEGGNRSAYLRGGRARFQIPKGEAFRITAPPAEVEARAGLITVHLWDDAMTIACHAGEALITARGAELALAAGTGATVGPAGITPTPLDDAESQWTAGKLAFRNSPLRQVVADLARYRSGPIYLRGGVRDLRVSGIFAADAPDAALDAIAAALPLHRRDLGPITILSAT